MKVIWQTGRTYGGRGIRVCERWQSYDNFVADMFSTWQEGLTIERLDNELGYSPENCKWIPKEEQGRNTRRIRYLTINGKTQSLEDWARETGLKSHTIAARIDKYGMTPEEAITTAKYGGRQLRPQGKLLTFDGRTMAMSDWVKETGIRARTINMRINYYGWTVERALTTKDGRQGK